MDDILSIEEVVQYVNVDDITTDTIAIAEASTDTFVLDTALTENLEIYAEPEDTIELVDAGISPGPAGADGTAATPVSCEIQREDGEITEIVFEDGRVVTINRTDGEITSVFDGTYTKTIIRENGEIIGVQVNG